MNKYDGHGKSTGLLTETRPTPRAPDKCGRSPTLSGQRPQPRQERGAGGRIRRLVAFPANSRTCR
jgi:hypothetical protein